MKFPFIKTIAGVALVISAAACSGNNNKTSNTDTAKATAAGQPKTAPVSASAGKLLGVWHDAAIHSDKGEQIAYELVSKDDKYYIQAITFTATNITVNDAPPVSPSASELKKDGDKYVSVDDPTQSYQVHADGDLVIYDGTEIVAKCKKLI